MSDELLHKLALSLIPGIGGHTFKLLISYLGSAKDVFSNSYARLKRVPGIGEATIALIKNHHSLKNAEKVIKDCNDQNIQILFHNDASYPKRLNSVYDSPAVLYAKGNLNLNPDKSISIVGTRKASRYGINICHELVENLKAHNVSVISGLAYGIDISAHKAALDQDLETVAILAGGLDKIYPASHKPFVEKMMQKGGILSEHPPGIIPDPPKFPDRNRIIAGLGDAVIVVEAAKKGGALITAELANGYNKEVFAVPGNINSPFSEGCNNLIKEHKAVILTSVKDIEYYLNWDFESKEKQKKPLELESFSSDERSVIISLKEVDSLIIDELAWQTQIQIHNLALVLLDLEFRGLINSLPGKKYAISEQYK